MKQFMNDQYVTALPHPTDFQNDFSEFLNDSYKPVGSLADGLHPLVVWLPVSSSNNLEWTIDAIRESIVLPNHYYRSIFDSSEVLRLTELYSKLYSVSSSEIEATSTFYKYSSCCICSKVVGGFRSRSSASSFVMVLWDFEYFGPSPGVTNTMEQEIRPARINFLAKHTVTVKEELYEHLLVSLSWFKHHPLENTFGKPVSIWESDLFEIPGVHSVIPVQFIRSRAVSLIDKVQEHDPTVLFVIPCVAF